MKNGSTERKDHKLWKKLLLLRSNLSRQHSEEERQENKENWSEEKVVEFSSASLFPARKPEEPTQVGTI